MSMEKTPREKLVDELAAKVFLAIFDDSEDTLDKIIERIQGDPRIPDGLKAEVYQRCIFCLNQILLETAKKMPESRPIRALNKVLADREGGPLQGGE